MAPYSSAVVNAMRRLYPEALADKSFDNTGLLLEAPARLGDLRKRNRVLLTVDLTKAVADEAISGGHSIVVAYHPIIFRGLKSLTMKDTQQQSLLRLAAQGISVYCPHTAVDSAKGGLNDWLADIVTGAPTAAEDIKTTEQSDDVFAPSEQSGSAAARPVYMLQHHPSQLSLDNRALELGKKDHQRYSIVPTTVEGHAGAGMGRIVRLSSPVPLTTIIDRIGLGLGNPKGFPIAVPQGKQIGNITIGSIGICAGSGGHLFGEMDKAGEDVDLLFTGELSHHEALAAIEQGRSVICLFHSNTERGFLHSVLREQLQEAVAEEWTKLRKEEGVKKGLSEEYAAALKDDTVEVHVSKADRDPYGIMISNNS